MIVRIKGGSKKIHLSEKEITLDKLKECGNILFTPNVDYVNRSIIVSFPHEKTFPSGVSKEDLRILMNEWKVARDEEVKLYEVLADMVNKQMSKLVERLGEENPEIKGKKLPNMSLSEVFVPSLGKLIIER